MKSARKLLATVFASLLLVLAGATAALAQTPIDPSATVTENESATAPINPFGLSISIAMILGIMGLLVVLVIIIRYMRYAPRFSQDEESMKIVRADRVVLGRSSLAATSICRRPLRCSWRRRPCRRRFRRLAPRGPRRDGRPGTGRRRSQRPPPRRSRCRSSPASRSSRRRSSRSPRPQPPRSDGGAAEVSLDQETFDATLKELLDAGTDRRIAEGKARRAAMIAARKKAAGEA